MKRVTASQAWTGVADCRNCSIRASVLFAGLEEADFETLHRPIDQLIYPPGATIYDASEAATALFTIRSGLVKLTQLLPDGTQRIVRLLRKTDIIGWRQRWLTHTSIRQPHCNRRRCAVCRSI